MNIGIVSQWYRPEVPHIPANVADDLAARGHQVRVLTGFPNYPGGRIHSDYHQRWTDVSTTGDGVTIRRVPLYPSHDASAVRRAANYLSFAATSAAAAISFLRDVDVIYVYLTPATVFAAPALMRALWGTPVVIHVQDLWPESVTGSPIVPGGVARWLTDRILQPAVRAMYRSTTSIAVIAPTMRDIVIDRGADPARVHTILNWADESLFRPVANTETARRTIGHRDRCTIMFAGAMGPFQNLHDSIRAAAAVEKTGRVDLVLVGSGVSEGSARALTSQLGASNVRFLSRRPAEDMAELYAAADFQLVTLRNLPIFKGTIPSKLPAALSCGSPVVVSVPGDCSDLVEHTAIGIVSPPDDWQALADRFLQAAAVSKADRSGMGMRARDCYMAQMSRRAGVNQLEDLLVDAAQRRRTR